MTDNIRAFVTTLGVTIIGEVVHRDEKEIRLNAALFMAVGKHPQTQEPIPQFAPCAALTDTDPLKGLDIPLQRHNIVFEHGVNSLVIEIYKQITGKISIASAGAIQQLDSVKKR
jgi:hypothetical protein